MAFHKSSYYLLSWGGIYDLLDVPSNSSFVMSWTKDKTYNSSRGLHSFKYSFSNNWCLFNKLESNSGLDNPGGEKVAIDFYWIKNCSLFSEACCVCHAYFHCWDNIYKSKLPETLLEAFFSSWQSNLLKTMEKLHVATKFDAD